MQLQLLKWFRYIIGYIFITSGMVKLLVPEFKGMFAALGFTFPHATLFLIAIIEIACGALITARMYLKYATIPLIVIMIGALFIAKFPIFLKKGLLSFVFESRLDFVMLVLLILLWHHHEEFD